MDSDWAEIRCSWLDEARWCRSVLAAEGIEALIPDEHTLSLPLTTDTEPGSVRVLIPSIDIERALELLEARGLWTPAE